LDFWCINFTNNFKMINRLFVLFLLYLFWNIWNLLLFDVAFFLDKLPWLWIRSPSSSLLKDFLILRLLEFSLLINILITYLIAGPYLFKVLIFSHSLFREEFSPVKKGLDGGKRLPFSVFPWWILFVSAFSEPFLKVFDDIGKLGKWFPCVAFVAKILPFDEVVRLV
jgi:hypothetical protein